MSHSSATLGADSAPRKRSQGYENWDDHDFPKRKKPRKESRKRRPGFDQEIYNETTYYTENGLRYVKPYYFTFTTHAKGRWVGSKVIDVFSQEFQSETSEFYQRAIKAGKITVNEKVATMDTVIGHNELVCHKVHRHEPPVTAQPLTIISNDEHLVVLDKPPSIPVHPCGRYRHNSVVFLLGKEHNLKNLHTIHRLDRLTSGLLMFAKTVKKAQQLEVEIRERRVTKIYVCRVKGEFPGDPVECNEPILVVSHKLGVCRVDPTGKECSTHFTRLSFNGSSSIVQCVPKTGRMHQIRVHLQWLGFPLMNDPLYNHPAWKESEAGEPVDMDHVISEIVKSNYTAQSNVPTPSMEDERDVKKGSLPLKPISDPLPLETDGVTCKSKQVLLSESKTSENQDDNGCSTSGETIDQSLKLPDSAYTSRTSTIDRKVNSSVEASAVSEQVTRTELLKADCETVGEGCEGHSEKAKHSQEELSGMTMVDSGEHSPVAGDDKECKALKAASSFDPDCTECRTVHPDPTPNELMMYLHALSYKGEGWEYSTAMPEWALPDWKEK